MFSRASIGAMSLPLVLAALLPLVLVPGSAHTLLAAIVNVVAWIIFLVDFVVHQRRLRGYLSTWLGRFDLVVVILTAPWFVFLGPSQSDFVLLIRLARISRLVMAGTGARRLFARLGRVAIVAAGVVFLGAAVAYRAEHPTNPGFKTIGDAIWWGFVTLTTVGYGDIVPQTSAGRVAGLMIMFTGIAVLGVLAGSLAGFFRLEGSSDRRDVRAVRGRRRHRARRAPGTDRPAHLPGFPPRRATRPVTPRPRQSEEAERADRSVSPGMSTSSP